MAKNAIKGITVEIGGNTVGLQKALGDVNKKSGELSAELRQVNNALKFDPTNTTLLAQKQQILSEQIKNTSDKLQSLRSVQQQVEEQYRSGDIGAEAYRAFQRELETTESKLESLENEEKNVGKETQTAEKNTREFGKSLEGLKAAGETAVSAMGTVAGAVGDVMKATVDGTVQAGKAASQVGMSFESSVSQLAATMGTSVENVSELSEKAKELGATTQFSASQAAEGLNILAMSGLSAEEQTAAIGDVLNLAAAGSLSLAQAASYTTGAVKGFGDGMDNAQKYTDLMAKGATLANTDVNGLGAALSGAAATANSYGQNADGVTLALLRLAEQNITGSEAATSMSRAMADLYTPSDNAKKALEELGIAAYDQSGNTRDFNTVVDELNQRLSTMTDEQANAYKNTIFTTNGLNAFNKMTASSSETVLKFKDGLAAASDGAGSAADQAKTMIDNLQGDVTMMQSAAEGLGITFYETFNDKLRDNVQFATDSLGKLDNAYKADGIKGAAEAAGEILVDLSANAAQLVPDVISTATTLYDSVANALIAHAPELAATAGDIAVALADGIAGNTATILNAVTSVGDTVLEKMPDILESLISSAGGFARSIVTFLTRSVTIAAQRLPDIISVLTGSLSDTLPLLSASVLDLVTQTVNAVLELLPEILPDVLLMVGDLITAFLPQLVNTVVALTQCIVENLPVIVEVLAAAIPQLISSLLVAVLAQVPTLLSGVIQLADSIVAALPQIINAIIPIVPQIINAVVTQVAVFLPRIVSAGLQLFTSLINDLPKIITAITKCIPDIISAIIEAVMYSLPLLIDCGVELFVALVENMPEIIKGITDAIPRIVVAVTDVIESLHGKLVESGSKALLKLIEDVPVVIDAVKSKAREIVQAISDAIYSKYGDLIDAGYNLITGMWQGIANAKDWIIDKIGGFTDSVVDAFKDFFDIHSPSGRIEREVGEYTGEAVGTGTVKAMPKARRMIRSAVDDLVDNDVFLPSSADPRLTVNTLPQLSAAAQDLSASARPLVINFEMHIDAFYNSTQSSMSELTEQAMQTLYRLVRENKLAY